MALPTVNASHVEVKNLDTGSVYYTKGTGTVVPASLSKLLTVYIVRQNKTTGAELDEQVTIAAGDLTAGGTGANLVAGDILTIRQLLLNALIPSSNNSCLALARVIGQEFLDVESGGVGDPVARFVTEMATQASALGMSDSVFDDPHGFNTTSDSTPADINKIWPVLRSDTELLDIWRWGEYRITPISGSNKTVTNTNEMCGDAGIFEGKTGSIPASSIYNLSVLWEAPNGQVVAVTVMGCTTSADRFEDARDIIAQLPTDYPALATPGTPWTPAAAFTALSAGGGWWDASDTSTLWQDTSATTAVSANNDPVARWNSKAGTSGLYWRQATSGARPLWKSATDALNFDGTDDYLDIGGTTIGGTGLFASSTNEWMVYIRMSTTDTLGAILARAVSSSGSRTFYLFIDTGSSQNPGLTIRGNTSAYLDSLNSGSVRAVGTFRDGTDVAAALQSLGNHWKVQGSAAESTNENIYLGARTEAGLTSFLAGEIEQVVVVDQYDRDQFFRMRAWAQGAAVNAFADPTGGTKAAPPMRAGRRMQHLLVR